jgi:mannose-6-phosphate isomerase-like protein (cupin superfamily)
MDIQSFEFTGEGMHRVYENEKCCVGIKNWKPANDITGISNLERHNTTDEMFVLVEGHCTLIQADENPDGSLSFKPVPMEKGKLYVIPRSEWHNTITEKDTKMFLIEDSNCSGENSDVRDLTKDEIAKIQSLVK